MIDPRIYLASRSPRRRELLSQIGIRFDLLLFRAAPREDAEVSEAWLPDETPEAYVQRVARIKAAFGADSAGVATGGAAPGAGRRHHARPRWRDHRQAE
jgi:septum formation protein